MQDANNRDTAWRGRLRRHMGALCTFRSIFYKSKTSLKRKSINVKQKPYKNLFS
jgi:hypothetical protein